MKPRMGIRRAVFSLVALAALAGAPSAYAQTQGMERRDERRDDRQGARAVKQDCKAGDEKTRAECRHMKRTTKQHLKATNGKPAAAAPAPQ